MAAQQKTFAQRAESSDQASIRYRPPVEGAPSWEIVREPVQRRMTQSPIVNLGSGGANCH